MNSSLAETPVALPPHGVQSNFDDPSNQMALANLILGFALSTTTVFAWMRFLVKWLIMQQLHVEDYIVPFAWLAAVGQMATGFVLNDIAPWVHSWDVNMEDFGTFLLWHRMNTVCYCVSIALIKTAMLSQVLRIFIPHGPHSRAYYIIHILLWSNMTFYIVVVFLMLFGCSPIQKAWTPWLAGHCINVGAVGMSSQAVNLVVDLCILAVAQKAIWALIRIDQKQRVRLSLVFCTGLIPCGFAIICVYYSSRMLSGEDFIYDSAFMTASCYGEVASGMFVLFLPVLPRFFTHLKTVSTFNSSLRRASAFVNSDSSTPTGNKEPRTKEKRPQSMWHVSYKRGHSDDLLPIAARYGNQKDDFTCELRRYCSDDSVNRLPIQSPRKESDASIHKLPIQGVDT